MSKTISVRSTEVKLSPVKDSIKREDEKTRIRATRLETVRAAKVRKAFLGLPEWKRNFLNNVGKGERSFIGGSFSVLARELWGNSHKYPNITQDDLALAWEYNTGSRPLARG